MQGRSASVGQQQADAASAETKSNGGPFDGSVADFAAAVAPLRLGQEWEMVE